MKHFTLSTFSILLFLQVVFSQTPTPTPIEEDNDVVKISTNLIQIDVTVTDKKGNPITDLKRDEIEIYENGKKQEITNFSFISKKSTSPKSTKQDKQNVDVLNLPNEIRPNEVRRTIALVVDDLTLSFTSTHFVRRALNKFVDEQMLEGDLVAIIRTGAGIGALQQFTSDKRMLKEAIKRIIWNPRGTGNIGAFAPLEAAPDELPRPASEQGDNRGADLREREAEQLRNSLDEINNFRSNLFATGTLGALNYIVRGMQELPGRKSVMLFSDGFEIFSTNSRGFVTASLTDRLNALIDQANRASVVVYTLDARGLVVTGITAADNTGGRSFSEIREEADARRDKLFKTQDGLRYLAEETGGFAYLNSNRLDRGVENVLKDQSYYLVGYQPDDETFDSEKLKFNKISIKVKRKGVKVRYRSGFLGMSDESISKTPKEMTPRERIENALASPFAINDIKMSLNTLFKSDANKSLYLNSFVFIDLKDLKSTDEKNGDKKFSFELLAISFGDNGIPTDHLSKAYTLTLKANEYERVVNDGLIYSFSFPVKKAGAYQMRVAIRDMISDKVGSANQFAIVPKLNKKRLTLSGLMLKNVSYKQWNTQHRSTQISSKNQKEIEVRKTNPMAATSLRQFKRNTVLLYGFEIYNAKYDKNQKPQILIHSRLFHNGKVVYEGKPKPVDSSLTNNYAIMPAGGALNLGSNMQLGEYVLQIIATNKHSKNKRQIASEFVQFEIVE